MNSTQIYHQVISIPPMKRLERERVLQREIEQTAKTDEQELVSFWSAGQRKTEDTIQEKILCCKIPRFLADVIIGTLSGKDLNFIGFTSYTQMICHLATDQKAGPSRNLAMLEISDREGSITLFADGLWLMERRFLVGVCADSNLDKEKLLLEVERALRYFRQQMPQESLERILLYGATTQVEEISRTLESAAKLKVERLFVDDRRFHFVSDTSASLPSGQMPLVNISCVAALHSRFDRYIDFVPAETRERGRATIKRYTMAAMVFAFYGILSLIWVLVHREAVRLEPRMANLGTARLAIFDTPQQAEQVIKLRVFSLAALQAERWLKEKHRVPSELIRELAETVPSEMKVSSVQFREVQMGWQVTFGAGIKTVNGSVSQELLFQFQNRARATQWLKHLTVQEIELQDESLDHDSNGGNVLTFNMSGKLPYSAYR